MNKTSTVERQIKTFDPAHPVTQKLLRQINNPFLMSLYMWKDLPGAKFMGVSVDHCSPQECIILLPYRWRSKNPFKSIYFAAQCAAAEMSTGLIARVVCGYFGNVSMLVLGVQTEFVKKAKGKTRFVCSDGPNIISAIEKAYNEEVPQLCNVRSEGINEEGEKVSSFEITWSFKRR